MMFVMNLNVIVVKPDLELITVSVDLKLIVLLIKDLHLRLFRFTV
jgi:hypothetical protein